MKRTIVLLLMLALSMSLLTACGEKKTVSYTEEIVTEEEQLERTGIELVIPEYSDDIEYLILRDGQGKEIPQVNFTYNDVSYCYRAEPTDQTEPYNFSGLNEECEWTGEGSTDRFEFISGGYRTNGWCAWVDSDKGIAYVVFSTNDECSSVDCIATMLSEPENMITSDDESWEVTVPTLADMLKYSVWKYDNYDAYVHIRGNQTYAFYGADKKATDEKIRFWKILDDETMLLYNEFGGEDMILTAKGTESADLEVTDEAGDTLSAYEGCMDGTYYCGMNEGFLHGDVLYLTAQQDYWLSDWTVKELEVGSIINNTDMDFMGIEVTAIEKKSDTWFVITDEMDDKMDLRYDEAAGAWLLSQSSPSWERVGTCTIDANTQFTDTLDGGAHSTLAECLAAHDTIYANVTVENGAAAVIDVVSEF